MDLFFYFIFAAAQLDALPRTPSVASLTLYSSVCVYYASRRLGVCIVGGRHCRPSMKDADDVTTCACPIVIDIF